VLLTVDKDTRSYEADHRMAKFPHGYVAPPPPPQGAAHCSSLNFGLGSSGPVLGISGSELDAEVEYTFKLTINKAGMVPQSTTQTVRAARHTHTHTHTTLNTWCNTHLYSQPTTPRWRAPCLLFVFVCSYIPARNIVLTTLCSILSILAMLLFTCEGST